MALYKFRISGAPGCNLPVPQTVLYSGPIERTKGEDVMMKRGFMLLLMLALLLPADGLADDVPDRPAFLDGYTDYKDYDEYDGWYLACLDTSPDNEGDAFINDNTHWVLLDGEGNVLYEDLHYLGYSAPFQGWREGSPLAPLRIDGKWGYVDHTGTMVIAPAWDDVWQFFDGTAVVAVKGDTKYAENPYGDGVLVDTGTRYGLIDLTGKVLYEPVYEDLHNGGEGWWGQTSGNGLVVLQQDRKWALGDNKGALLTDFLYDDIVLRWQSDDPIEVVSGLDYGFLNPDGTALTPLQYQAVHSFSEDLAAVQEQSGLWEVQSGLWGFIDRTGATVIEAKYQDAGSFSCGLAAVCDSESYSWGYIDATGAWAIEPAFLKAYEFTPAGYAEVELDSGKYGVIDRAGKVLLETEYDVAISDDGIVTVNSGYGEDTAEFYDLSSGEAKPATILTASMDLTDYMPFTGKKVAKLSGKPTLAHRVSYDHDLPHLDGATALFPVYSAFVQALYPSKIRYQGWDPEAPAFNPLITCTKTNVAYERLIDGQADIIFVAQPSDEELQMAEEKGVEFDMLPIGREAFVFVVNQQNPVEGLLLNEIRWIYAGLIKDWSEVGVDGLGAIIPYQRPKNSGSQTALEALMGDMPLMEAPQEIVAWDMGDILETVEYRNLPNALGYSFRFFCTEMMQSDVKLLAVDGVAPTVENIRNESYPLTSTLYAIRLKSNTENPNVNALWEWLQGDQAAELVEKSGYVAG